MNGATPDFYQLPESVQRLVGHGVALVQPQQVILFGSRARGDHSDTSDFDLVFKQIGVRAEWSRLAADYEHEAITLRDVDLLIYEETASDLRRRIDAEGVVLYAAA